MTKLYNLHANVCTRVGTFAGRANSTKYKSLEDAIMARDELEANWSQISYVVLFNVNGLAATGATETFIPGDVLKNSVVNFTILEDY